MKAELIAAQEANVTLESKLNREKERNKRLLKVIREIRRLTKGYVGGSHK